MLSIPTTRNLLTHPTSRPAIRDKAAFRLREVRAIIMHWTANTDRGADALANRNYFNLGLRPASAHYVVDDHSIVQCLPDNEVGYHVGARRYEPAGRAIMQGGNLGPNFYTIGIEMCVNRDGDWEKTYRYSAELAAFLLLKHMPETPVLLRHFDITGKDCPKMMLDAEPWEAFCDLVEGLRLGFEGAFQYRGASLADGLNARTGPGMQFPVVYQLYGGEPVLVTEEVGNWLRVDNGHWVHGNFIARVSI